MKQVRMASPYFSPEDKKKIYKELEQILDNKLSMGPNVKKFEENFSKRIKSKYSIAMNSCTATLEAALNFYDVKNKEVIIPTQTFIATGMAVYHSGAKPVFAEINKKNLSIDIEDIKKKINKNTAGVIIVHMGGYISDKIFELKKFCDENNLFLIEDSAHTPGAKINNQEAGTIGHVGCFSFYSTKIITAGEGGMLVTNNTEIALFARSYQNRGADMSLNYELYVNAARNVRMTEFSALLGRVQLEKLDIFLSKRRKIALAYKERLQNLNFFNLILPDEIEQTSCWKIPLILKSNIDRNFILDQLNEKKIFADKAYDPPLHLQPVMKKIFSTYKGQLPISEAILSQNICLPSHQKMSINDVDYVCENLIRIIKKF